MKGLKFAILFAFVLSAGSVAGNWFLYQQFLGEKTAREDLESEVVQLEERSGTLEADATRYRKEVDGYREQLRERNEVIQDLEEKLKQIRGVVESQKQEIGELKRKSASLNESALTVATEKAVTQETAKLPVIPAAKAEAGTPSPTAAPVVDQRPKQVLSVNRKFGFVVVNLGVRDQIKVGDTLRVEQGGKLAGRIQVDKLYDNFSACVILEEIKPAQIQEGDLVRLA